MQGTLTAQSVSVAEIIPDVTADEPYTLQQAQLDRFLAVIETLEPEDWSKPTACSE